MRMKDLSLGMENETPDRRWISATPSHVFWISKGKELEGLSAFATRQNGDQISNNTNQSIDRSMNSSRRGESKRSRPRRGAAKLRQKGRFSNALLPDRPDNEKVAVLRTELLLVVAQNRIEMSVKEMSVDVFTFSLLSVD